MTAPGRYHHTGVRAHRILVPRMSNWFDAARQVGSWFDGCGYDVHVEHEARHPARDLRQMGAELRFAADAGAHRSRHGPGCARARWCCSHCDALTREACELAALEGVVLDADERVAFDRELFRTAGGKASMLQDIEAGRRTEIDTISGAAVRIADRHGHPAPLNRAMVALVKGREVAMGIARDHDAPVPGGLRLRDRRPATPAADGAVPAPQPCGAVHARDVPTPDLILVSHAAWDHLGDAAEIARRTGAPVVCPADVAELLYEQGLPVDQVRASIWGVCYAFGDIVVRPVECHHWSAATLRGWPTGRRACRCRSSSRPSPACASTISGTRPSSPASSSSASCTGRRWASWASPRPMGCPIRARVRC